MLLPHFMDDDSKAHNTKEPVHSHKQQEFDSQVGTLNQQVKEEEFAG